MNRRTFLKKLGISTVAFGLPACIMPTQKASVPGPSGKQPNIIFLLADDQCTYSVGCYGNTAFAGKFGFVVDGKGLCEEDFDIWGGGPGQTNYETAKNKSMAAYAEKYPHSTLAYGVFGQDVIKQAGYYTCTMIGHKTDCNFTTTEKLFEGKDWKDRKKDQPFSAR